MNDHIRTIKNIKIVFVVLLVISICSFILVLFSGKLDLIIVTGVSVLMQSIFVGLLSAIIDGFVTLNYKVNVTYKNTDSDKSYMPGSSKKLSPGAKSSAWRDFNEENR